MDFTIYIGPFAQCQNGFLEIETPIRSCTNRLCRSHKKFKGGKFCDDCGAAVGDVPIPGRQQKVVPNALQQSLSGLRLARGLARPTTELPGQPPDTDLWIPVNGPPYARIRCKRQDPMYFLPSPDLPEKEVACFQHDFAAQIEKLKAAYQSDCVTFHWGVLMFTL